METALKTSPVVFAVGDTYQITVCVKSEALVQIKIGNKSYASEISGVMRSSSKYHKITVPSTELENAGEYTVCCRNVVERKPYFTETAEAEEKSYKFSPVKKGGRKTAYHISDVHGLFEEAKAAVSLFEEKYGRIDFLISNGDLAEHSGEAENLDMIYELLAEITGGRIPVVYARGNHDTRGSFAEKTTEIFPSSCGDTYFSFTLGDIWGLVLDCGEDKEDSFDEYGNTACFKAFRERETRFIESITSDKDGYMKEDIKHRIIVSHIPFTRHFKPPFDIEEERYAYWAKLLGEEISPDIMLCGHKHKYSFDEVGGENDALGQPCTVVLASEMDRKTRYFGGSGIIFDDDGIEVIFNDKEKIIASNKVEKSSL